jgi:hypothetical protein
VKFFGEVVMPREREAVPDETVNRPAFDRGALAARGFSSEHPTRACRTLSLSKR